MDNTQKLLAKIPKKDLRLIVAALQLLVKKEVSGIKLKGKNIYRLRVGKYRILYEKKSTKHVILEVRKRDEHTYKK